MLPNPSMTTTAPDIKSQTGPFENICPDVATPESKDN